MKLKYRKEAIGDLEWFKTYYARIFPSGAAKARVHFQAIRNAVLLHPDIGHPIIKGSTIREIVVPKTPFSLIYSVSGETITILRLLDNRSQRPGRFE